MKWLEGKKTYLSAAALALLAVGGFWSGFIGRMEAYALLVMASGLVGLGHKIDRQIELVLNLVEMEKQKQNHLTTEGAEEGPQVDKSVPATGHPSRFFADDRRDLKYEPIDRTGEERG